jgi:plasmid maintenance system antidote protein VapI
MTALMRARDPDEIRAAMKARGALTIRELAKLADSTRGTVGFILDGRSTSRDTAIRIARVLRRGVDVLFVAAASSDKQDNDKQDAAEDAA